MKITLVYIAVTHGQKTEEYAARFSASYSEFPPGVPHDTVVVTNGGPLPYSISLLFSALKPKFYPRVNDPGWDISAYIELARGFCKDSQMMLCCGESIYFHQEGMAQEICGGLGKNWTWDVWIAFKQFGSGTSEHYRILLPSHCPFGVQESSGQQSRPIRV